MHLKTLTLLFICKAEPTHLPTLYKVRLVSALILHYGTVSVVVINQSSSEGHCCTSSGGRQAQKSVRCFTSLLLILYSYTLPVSISNSATVYVAGAKNTCAAGGFFFFFCISMSEMTDT